MNKFREEIKNEFNSWIINNTNFINFEKEVGYLLKKEYHFNEGCDSGDHLHPSKYAYDLMGRLAFEKLYSNN